MGRGAAIARVGSSINLGDAQGHGRFAEVDEPASAPMWFSRKTPKVRRVLSGTQTILSVRLGSFTIAAEGNLDGTIDEILRTDDHVAQVVDEQGGTSLNAFNGQYTATFGVSPAAFRAARALVERID
ncbi:MAG: hypothetical protein JSS20_21485, partial [Proteobacteria bacterium]|nr:hypothetical protein [Pseudomonadota bacterium]